MGKKLILWDIDGTLVKINGAGTRAFFNAFRQVFQLKTLKADVSFAGGIDRGVFNQLCCLNQVDKQPAAWDEFVIAYLYFLEQEAKNLQNWELLPGTVEILNACQDKYHYGLLTGNIRAGAIFKLRLFNLEHFFKCGGFGDQLTDKVALAKIALDNCRQFFRCDFSPEDITVIGDSPVDIQCARALQCICYIIHTGHIGFETLVSYRPDKIVKNLQELNL